MTLYELNERLVRMDTRQFTSAVISIVTGLIVAILVGVVPFIGDQIKRRNEISYIRTFIRAWESEIKNMQGAEDGRYTRTAAQFAYHKERLRTAMVIVSARAKHLTDEQSFEIAKVITHQLSLTEFISVTRKGSSPDESFYDMFFNQLRELKWLKF